MNQETKSLPMWRKLGYGVGDWGSAYTWTLVSSFALIYFTNIVGLSAAVVGSIMAVSKLLDGISDVFMGQVIDKTNHKMGKARFWYFISIVPTAVSMFLLFNVPASFTENTKYIYIFITYTLLGAVFYTMNNIAYASLTALVTKNKNDRVAMGSYRYIFGIIGALIMSSTTPMIVEAFGGGQIGWRYTSLIYTVLCCVLYLVPVFCVKELPQEELEEGETKPADDTKDMNLIDRFKLLGKNRYFILHLSNNLIGNLTAGVTGGVAIYFATYILLNPSALGILNLATLAPIMLALPFIPKISAKFGIRKSCLVGSVISIVGGIVMLLGQNSLAFILVGSVIARLGAAPPTGAGSAFIAEIDDYSHLKFGRRITGSIFSCSSVGLKLGTGLGTAICGFCLDLSGFNGLADAQAASALTVIRLLYVSPFIIAGITGFVFMYFNKVEKVNQELRIQGE